MLQQLQRNQGGIGLGAKVFVTTWAKDRNYEKTHICKDRNVEMTAVTTAECLNTKASLMVRKGYKCILSAPAKV